MLLRLNRLCTTGRSAQISDSNTLPSASNTPTTVQRLVAKATVWPISKPWNSRSSALPTTISLAPGLNMRPSTILMPLRTAAPSWPMPRKGRLALVWLERLMPSTTR